MILNARNNGFAFIFPPDFFAEEIKEKYKKYYQSLIIPFDTIEDFMSSTIQSIEFPGWNMNLVQQTRILGKKQEYKNSKPIEDVFTREFTLTFKMTDAFLNYWIFLDNALNYINFNNTAQTFSPMLLSMVDNQGYLVSTVRFNNPILKGQDSLKFSYSSVVPEFRTFTAKFNYIDFDLNIEFS